MILVFTGMAIGQVLAAEAPSHGQGSNGKAVTVRGTLIDTDCYFKEGLTGDEHDDMKGCGKACLLAGVPAAVLAGGKVYILVFPSKAFAVYVGKTVEIQGEAWGDNLIHPQKAFVVDPAGKKPIKLRGFEMM